MLLLVIASLVCPKSLFIFTIMDAVSLVIHQYLLNYPPLMFSNSATLPFYLCHSLPTPQTHSNHSSYSIWQQSQNMAASAAAWRPFSYPCYWFDRPATRESWRTCFQRMTGWWYSSKKTSSAWYFLAAERCQLHTYGPLSYSSDFT